jgi:carbon storage regulator
MLCKNSEFLIYI